MDLNLDFVALAKPKQTLYGASPFHVQEAIFLFVLPPSLDKTALHKYLTPGHKKRHGGLIVSELDSGLSGLGSSPCQGHCVVFLGKTLMTLTVPLFTQVYKWVLENLMLGVTLRWTSIPSRVE